MIDRHPTLCSVGLALILAPITTWLLALLIIGRS
jgi:hypothetical protein